MAISLYGTPGNIIDLTGTDSSIAIPIPGGGTLLSAPALVVLSAVVRGGTPTFSTPSGYTLLTSITDLAGSDSLYVFYQNYASGQTPPATVTVTAGATWTYGGGNSVAYQGHNASSPIDGAGVTNRSTGGSPFSGTGVTTTLANDQVLWTYHVTGDVGAGSVTNSQGTQEIINTRSATSANFYQNITDATFASSGATGANSLTWGGGATSALSIAFAIAQAAAGGGGGTTSGSANSLGGQFSTNFPGWSQFQ